MIVSAWQAGFIGSWQWKQTVILLTQDTTTYTMYALGTALTYNISTKTQSLWETHLVNS